MQKQLFLPRMLQWSQTGHWQDPTCLRPRTPSGSGSPPTACGTTTWSLPAGLAAGPIPGGDQDPQLRAAWPQKLRGRVSCPHPNPAACPGRSSGAAWLPTGRVGGHNHPCAWRHQAGHHCLVLIHIETGALQPMPACHGVRREADAGHKAPQLWWWPGTNLAPSQGLPRAGVQGCVGPCNSSATRERSSCGSPGAAGSLTAGASSSWEKPWDLQHSFLSCFGAGAHHNKDPGRSPFCSTHAKASPTAGPGHSPPLQHPWDPFTHCWSSKGQAGMQIHRHRSSQ